jgi:hypothetical protein
MEKESSNTKEFSFKCGEMKVEDGKVKPSPTKGKVKIFYNPDSLLCWQWVSEDSQISAEPLVIFSDEWEWLKITVGKGRVYQLKSKCFEDVFIYWMQDSDLCKDMQTDEIVNKILLDGKLEIKNENTTNSKPVVDSNKNSQSINDVISQALKMGKQAQSNKFHYLKLYKIYYIFFKNRKTT